MRTRSTLLFGVALAWFTGCASPRAQTYTDPRFDPAAVHTYAWVANQRHGVRPQDQLALDGAVLSAVDGVLTRRGWQRVTAEEADIWVRYVVAGQRREVPTKTGTTHIMGVEREQVLAVREVRDGELAIDLIDPESRTTFWRGVGHGTQPTGQSAQQVRRAVDRGARGILRELPR